MKVLLDVLIKYLENHPDQIEKLIETGVEALISYLKSNKPTV